MGSRNAQFKKVKKRAKILTPDEFFQGEREDCNTNVSRPDVHQHLHRLELP